MKYKNRVFYVYYKISIYDDSGGTGEYRFRLNIFLIYTNRARDYTKSGAGVPMHFLELLLCLFLLYKHMSMIY